MSAPDFHSLSRRCVHGICHCDWRLTLQDCVESRVMTIIHGINVGISGITVIIGIILLSHRVIIKGHRLFDRSLSKGCFRPKPIDCMLLFIILFNLLRLISSTILITDICPDMISRSFIYEFPWQFGLGAFALYLIGIAQTLADSHRVLANSWLPSPKVVDFIGCTIFFSPFIINNAMSLSAGILAETNLPLAETFTRLLYIFWFIHCFSLAVAVFFAAYRLTRILGEHLKKFNTTGPRYISVKTGIFKIRAVMTIITICLLMFAVFLLAYGVLRDMIIVNELGSVVLGGMWTYLGAVSTLGVEIAIIFNPKVDDTGGLGIRSTGDEDKSNPAQFVTYSNFSTQEYSVTNSNPNAAQGTLSHNAFDELKLQQLQYQKVFQKHNQHQLPHKNNMADISTAESRQLKLSPAGIPMEDDEYYPNQNNDSEVKMHPFPLNHHQSHHLDDDRILDDGESSQMDLVEYASKN
ncbi:uncharacterized protein EV154DRAFT_502938 [Mucor mucedo]|uniref:uncharacterized protein n=1 Tax=Mucor mucedo TaxID=29922 RepID=UPI00221EE5AF|nr:uncharacterized protein EV154DRAFT_502938 [Mucor mucedo]KAI7892991.1 hypothetical protein EV154DRAFT_502938 [Mucor mucedo]